MIMALVPKVELPIARPNWLEPADITRTAKDEREVI